MSKKLKMKLSAIVLSLTLLGLLVPSYAVKADPPATATVPATASPGTSAIEKAAKENKYLFIFFSQGKTHRRMP